MTTLETPNSSCTCGHLIEALESRVSGGSSIQTENAPMEGSSDVFCKSCSTQILTASIARFRTAVETRHLERADFERRLLAARLVDSNIDGELTISNTRPLPDPSHIHHQVYQLRQRLDRLRSISNELAIKVTSKTMENDERQLRYEVNYAKIDLGRERLESMRQSLLVNSEHLFNNEEKKAAGISNQLPNVGGGLRDALASGTRQIQTTRFCFALRVFEMHRIDVGEEYSHLMCNKEYLNRDVSNASGVGKVCGLPLPHAGPALYGVLPPGMLASSLRLVASLTNILASCLGVVLPHPILSCSKECTRCGKVYKYGVDVVETTIDHDADSLCSSCECDDVQVASEYHELHEHDSQTNKSQSTRSSLLQKIPSKTSVLSFVGSSARKAVALATGSTASSVKQTSTCSDVPAANPTSQIPSIQSKAPTETVILRRINYASFAVLLENHESGAAEYILNPPRWKEDSKCATNAAKLYPSSNHTVYTTREEFHAAEEKFSTGLQLLQNDVIALCFRAGVDASSLWPAESMLLNLYMVQSQILEHVK